MDVAFKTIMNECYSHPVEGPEALGDAAGTFRTVLEDHAAVAAAAVGTIAVVGPEGANQRYDHEQRNPELCYATTAPVFERSVDIPERPRRRERSSW